MESISEIERNDLEFLHDLATEYGIEYFNVRMGQGTSTTFSILNGITKIARNGSSRGFSIQTFKKGGWGLALGHDFKKKSLEYVFKESAKLAAFSAKYTNEIYEIPNISVENNEFKIEQKIPFTQVGADEKIKFLLDLEKNAKIEPRIKTTRLNYSDGSGEAIYFNGAKFLRMKKSASFIIFESIAKEGVNQQRYHETHGGLGGFEVMKKRQDLGKAASKNALELLESTSIKAGKYDII